MARQLTQCPYCHGGMVALDDDLGLAFALDDASAPPCPHVIWVEGRYSQWGLSALPGRKTKIARMIGSNEFAWHHPGVGAMSDPDLIEGYLKELAAAGSSWESAPPVKHTVRAISAEETHTEPDGKTYPNWEVEGTAIFAADAGEFLASLPGCLEQRESPFSDLAGPSQ